MEKKKGDPRIYIVIALFFACLVSGGVLLALYMFLPENNVNWWYSIAGMILVAIPWAFWFLTCIYRCIRPVGYTNSEPCTSPLGSPFSRREVAAAASSPRNPPFDDEPQRPSSDGSRHVHFGRVVVVSNENDDDDSGDQDERKSMEGHSGIEHEGENSVN
ncbi:unnamed protein product [Dovyalis caffra]|uniref:Transmembrane protein n=1 Tax=Dovyalis caffra TaxID=77055 RepID=A0AAV1RH20_9ROSI|nr:unnamed protein product [Dovyalis caffra]